MALYLLQGAGPDQFLVPITPPLDDAVAPNFERFDGLNGPEDNYDAHPPVLGLEYGHTPRPGAVNSPESDIVYTPGPLTGVTGTLGGQPLPVKAWEPAAREDDSYTPGRTFRYPQFNLGKNKLGGQNNNGVEQTIALSQISQNPPQPGDLASIIAGL